MVTVEIVSIVDVWVDWVLPEPRGAHVDRYALAEGLDQYDLDAAWEAVADMLRSA